MFAHLRAQTRSIFAHFMSPFSKMSTHKYKREIERESRETGLGMKARESPNVECILSLLALALFCSLLKQVLNLNICVIVFTQLVTFTHIISVYVVLCDENATVFPMRDSNQNQF